MTATPDMNLYYGPRVVVDPHIKPDHHPGRIDGLRLGDILLEDFSKVPEGAWDNVLVRFTDRLPPSRAGLLVDLSQFRQSARARLGRERGAWTDFLVNGTVPVGTKQLERWSIGRNVVAVINMLPGSSDESFFSEGPNMEEEQPNRNYLLATMMHMSAGRLLESAGLQSAYGQGQIHSHAYALATADKWTGVIENSHI